MYQPPQSEISKSSVTAAYGWWILLVAYLLLLTGSAFLAAQANLINNLFFYHLGLDALALIGLFYFCLGVRLFHRYFWVLVMLLLAARWLVALGWFLIEYNFGLSAKFQMSLLVGFLLSQSYIPVTIAMYLYSFRRPEIWATRTADLTEIERRE
ncbi:MAG: hypothetical protein HWE11_11845 [Gammaproteobacteria bacterium]|nr:hypothetical protein [Gammaproteobacteria bacterium]